MKKNVNIDLCQQKEKIALNTFKESDDKIVALAVVFKNEACLCKCSGLKFFSDELGINNVD